MMQKYLTVVSTVAHFPYFHFLFIFFFICNVLVDLELLYNKNVTITKNGVTKTAFSKQCNILKDTTLTRCACSKCQIPAANIIDAISSSTLFVTVFSSSSIKFDHLNLNEINMSSHFLSL